MASRRNVVTQWPPDNNLWAALAGTLGRTRAHFAGMRRITSWDELRSRVGEPKAILCLGNGPSSEGTGIESAGFDCLFRVNWIWSDRSIHRDPNVVFTADLDAPPGPAVPIVCFPTRQDANLILESYARRRIATRTEYLVFPELASPFSDRTWSHRPTNGALMVAAAALLRPARLIIAGIDLYLHPDGKYPGATDEPNEYDAMHDRNIDLAFIRVVLDRFGGDIDIRSQQLRTALATGR